jgi:UDP-N-acetylmuramate dehydrogenase
MAEWAEILRARAPGRILTPEPLDRHCSFKVGGEADAWFEPRDEAALAEALKVLRAEGVSYIVLGGGTNVLPGDKGFRGAVIRLRESFSALGREGETMIRAGAGASLNALCEFAKREKLKGMAYAAGIPGTVGGAIACNAGTSVGDTSGIIYEIQVMNEEGLAYWVPKSRLAFSYRNTPLPEGSVVLAARLSLERGNDESLARDVIAMREATQPKGYPCAGSVFKNPKGDSAGRLIEEAGLKGAKIGGAEVSRVHANFIINKGNATAADIRKLMLKVQREVWKSLGVHLEPEIRVFGRFSEDVYGSLP